MAKDICKKARINAPALLVNGAVIYDSAEDAVTFTEYLDFSAKCFVKDIICKFPEIGIEVTTDDGIITISENAATRRHRKEKYFESRLSDYESTKNISWIKCIAMTDDPILLEKVKQYMDLTHPQSCTLLATSPIFYEVLPKGTDKGKNIDKIAQKVGADKIFCIGDFYNDLGMVKQATVGAFVENAPEELKKYADYISCNVKYGAIADFINHIENFLKERKKI